MSSKRKKSGDHIFEEIDSDDVDNYPLSRINNRPSRTKRRLTDDSDIEEIAPGTSLIEESKSSSNVMEAESDNIKRPAKRGRKSALVAAGLKSPHASSTKAKSNSRGRNISIKDVCTTPAVEYNVPINSPSIVNLPSIPVSSYPPVPPSSAESLAEATEHTLSAHGLGSKQQGQGELEHISNDEMDWSQVGGLSSHLEVLHDMIMMPLVYPWLYENMGLKPPRGVLFTGPPGTGKTLTARALAATCSKLVGKNVTFYVRKGADCLSKWVGEAERQLRMLFEEAKKNEPSIIFFDEIDGLAPVRTSSQDQVHASIVSTQLALMDGLDSRGQVIVVGATNRVDAIDPALRRPGRFDRELLFSLPSQEARQEILNIHTRKWNPSPSDALQEALSHQTVGYCGADLASLCTEASLLAIRELMPKIRLMTPEEQKSQLHVTVQEDHFATAMTRIVPSSLRNNTSFGTPLPMQQKPLLQPCLTTIIKSLRKIWPESLKSQSERNASVAAASDTTPPFLVKPRLILGGGIQHGSIILMQALVHYLESFPCYNQQISSLQGNVQTNTLEESFLHVLREAKRNSPSILVIPDLDVWLETITETCRVIFTSEILNMSDGLPILVIASFSQDNNDPLLHRFLSKQDGMVEAVALDSIEVEKKAWFKQMVKNNILHCVSQTVLEAKVQQKKGPNTRIMDLTAAALQNKVDNKVKLDNNALEQQRKRDEVLLLHQRMFLRSINAHLIAQYKDFIMPSNAELHQLVVYLRDMQQSINTHKYQSIREYLLDIDLLVASVRTQYPTTTSHGRTLLNRAAQLQDTALVLCLGLDQSVAMALEVVALRLRSQPGGFVPWPGLMFVPDSSLLVKQNLNVPVPSQSTSASNNSKKKSSTSSTQQKQKKENQKSLFTNQKQVAADEEEVDENEDELSKDPHWAHLCGLMEGIAKDQGIDILEILYSKSRLCRGDMTQVVRAITKLLRRINK